MPHSTRRAVATAAGEFSPHPFLTDEQRSVLDAALATKQSQPTVIEEVSREASKDLNRSNSSNGSGPQGSTLQRSPSNKLKGRASGELGAHHRSQQFRKGQGKVKKGGAGGKFTWGAMMGDQDAEAAINPADPNYDSGEEHAVAYHSQKAQQIKSYKKAIVALIEEYYSSSDVNDTASTLQELEEPEFNHFFVKKACTMALDRHGREREMTSVLLSMLYSEVISPEQMQRGFIELVAAVDDLVLDVPEAADHIAAFLARAVVDDVLPPAFIGRVPADGSEKSLVPAVRHKCEAHLAARHAAERLLRVWGGQAGLHVEETKQSIHSMLQEYLASRDIGEVRRCLHGLAVPFFHHEVVKQALLLALDDSARMQPVVGLLRELSASSDISGSQMTRGFQRVSDNLDDTCLDSPQAKENFASVCEAARKEGWLEEGVTADLVPDGAAANGHPTTHSVQAFKVAAMAAIREYFDSADAAEVGRSLADLDEPGFTNIFVKQRGHSLQAMQLAMDRRDRERELVSALLPTLVPHVISGDQMGLGFTRLLASVEDLSLDIPDAHHLLALFLGRAVVDEVLPPSFLASVLPSLRNDSMGVAVVQTTGSVLSARHAAERLANCWHGGCQTVEQLRNSMQASLKEFINSGDEGEAARCIHDMAAPYYHHELVKRALLLGIEARARQGALLKLLAHLAESGEINQTQMRKGFDRVQASLDDLVLDMPGAREAFAEAREQALQQGWLTTGA